MKCNFQHAVPNPNPNPALQVEQILNLTDKSTNIGGKNTDKFGHVSKFNSKVKIQKFKKRFSTHGQINKNTSMHIQNRLDN